MGQASAIWIDVEDLFHYVRHNARLSGIQRLTYELYTALEAQSATGRRIGYVRIDPRTDTFRVVPWQQVRALCHGLTTSHAEPAASGSMQSQPRVPVRQMPRHLATALQDRLPGRAREQFRRFCALQSGALRSLSELGRESLRTGRRRPPGPPAVTPHGAEPPTEPAAVVDLPGAVLLDVARPGDWLLSLGASWHRTDYGQLLRRVREQSGMRTGLLFYDLIPLRRPEWCHHTLVDSFGDWLDGVLPCLDVMFAISRATADDVTRFLAERGADGAVGRVRTIPVGTGFPASAAAVQAEVTRVPDHALPPAGSYVLFVATIEARKNHLLMFQVWRRLLQNLPAEQVPTLVFAGRVGWLVADLMLQIANTNYCDGKLLIIEDPSDAVLMRLYDGCLFTVLPSLFEGWGLPVTESLAAGKPCVISNLTSLPEAGAGLARMLDPFDLNDAYRVIADTLADRDGLQRWQQEVRQTFRPVPWARSAETLLRGLDAEEQDRSVSAVAAMHA